jgi:undecaprenyl-diphosphatase
VHKTLTEKKMKKSKTTQLVLSLIFIALFILWTIIVKFAFVEQIGPNGTSVGLATINGFVSARIGVNYFLYNLTDWLSIIAILVAFFYAVLGLVQWIIRKSILKVDKSVLMLGVYYIVLIAVYLLFEFVVINYRPVLIQGCLEVSYPSSTTLLIASIMPTAIIELRTRTKSRLKSLLTILITLFTALMIIGRTLSGVHWLSDIIGGVLISTGLVFGYSFLIK